MNARPKSEAVHPHPDGDKLADAAIPRAIRLVGGVRESAWDVAQITDPLERDELVALAVALAAMVDDTKTPAELLAWLNQPLHLVPRSTDDNQPAKGTRTVVDPKYADRQWTDDELREAHAAHVRGRHPKTTAGEVEYQRRRHLKNKARKQQEAAA